MATAKQVYEIALAKIDEVNGNGSILSENPSYETRSLSILTSLQIELLPAHAEVKAVNSLDDKLLVSDRVAFGVLPFGLAAELLLLDNNMTAASFFNARYDELKKKIPTVIEPIEDKYSVGMM